MKDSYWLKSGFYTLSERGTALLFGFGGAMILFRMISQEQFGIWVLFLSITSVIEVGRVGLLQNALVRYLSTKEDEETGKITTASFALNGMMTALIVLLLLGIAPLLARWFEAPVLKTLFRIYCLTTVAMIPLLQCNYIQQANLDFKGIFWGSFVKSGIFFGFVVVLFLTGREVNLVELAKVQILGVVLGLVVSWFFAKKYARFSRSVDWTWVRRLFDYGIYVFGTNLSTQLYKNVDKLLLGSLPGGGKVAVALYDAAIRVSNLTDVPTASMAAMLFPQSARRMKEGRAAVKQLYEKAVGAIMAFMVPCIIGVLIFADWIILIVAGREYADAANILRITIFFGLFMPYAVQFGTVLDSIGRPKINFIYTICSLALTALFNYVLIQKYGAIGAALGTLLAYFATFVFMQIYLHKHLKVNPLKPFAYMLDYYKSLIKIDWKNLLGKAYETLLSSR